MGKKMTFSVSLSMLTKNFEKGAKRIESSLIRLRSQLRSFAAGIGLGLGFSELVDTAKKLDKAQTVLKNVSNGAKGYADNLKFVDDLSKKYNQDLTTLMNNYAKYHAVANQANIPLSEQKQIYESLTRASAYFNLSADETNGVMLAVTQMMSKGKVSSEELRGQLGERLPGAMGVMARALGVTTGELDEMLKKGQILAADVLPKFAEELNKVTTNINLDSIEGATTKMRNAFTELTGKLNIGDIYKSILNGITDALNYIANNLKKVGQSIVIVLGTLASKPLIQKSVDAWNNFFHGLEKSIALQTKKVDQLRERAMLLSQGSGIKIDDKTLQPISKPVNPKALKSYEKLKVLADDYATEQKILIAQQDQLNNKISTMGKRVGNALKNFLKMAGIQALYYAVALAISTIVTKVASWYKEQKRIKNIVSDTKKEFEEMANTLGGEEVELQQLQKSLEIESERERAIKKINQLLGLQDKAMFTLASDNDDINKKIEERIALLKQEREYQSAKKIVADATNRKQELEDKAKSLAAIQGIPFTKDLAKVIGQGSWGVQILSEWFMDAKIKSDFESALKEIEQLNIVIEEYSKILKDLSLSSPEREEILSPSANPSGSTGTTLAEEYAKIQKDYNTELRTLNEMKANQLITEEEYQKQLEELTLKTAESILALNDINENTDQFAKGIIEAAQAFIANVEKEDKVKDALDEYEKKVKGLQNQYKAGIITDKELNDGMFELLDEVLKTIGAFGELSGTAKELADKFKEQKRQKVFDEIGKETVPELGAFDTTFSYKQSNSEMYQQNAEYIEDYTDQLKNYITQLKNYKDELSGDELSNLNSNIALLENHLSTLTQKAETFSQAAKFAEVQEDIKNLKKELAEGIWDNISGIASAAERLTNSWKSLKDTMDDPDATGWEKFLTIFTTLISTIETIVSVIKTFQAAMAIAEGLSLATAAAEQAGIPVKIEDLVVTKAQAAATKELAVARHMTTAAAVPYPANIAAIASTSAALAAAFAAIPAFATGGVVPGNSQHGDKILARLNSGELVLNKSQQGMLWEILNSKGQGGNVSFEIRGDKLVGVLNNYNKKISK